MNMAVPSESLTAPADHRIGFHKWYVAWALCAAHTIAIIDRFVMVLVTEPVRAALHLSDTQLGLLQGTGFAILYCGFAVPLGAVADATSRRNLIMFGIAVWSLATMAAAFATSFETLFAARILVGMGEACLVPAGMSLLAAYFAPTNFARGTSIFGLGANFGYGLAFLGGGALLVMLQVSGGLTLFGTGYEPWKGIFLISGMLAVPVLAMLAFVREPPRLGQRGPGLGAHWSAMREGLGYLFRNLGAYAPFLLIGAANAVTGYAMTSWSSSVFVRLHGLEVAEAGKLIGLIGVIAGPLGTLSGGWALDMMRARGVAGAPLLIIAGGATVALATVAATVFVPSLPVATAFFCAFIFESTFTLPALYVGMQLLTEERYRGIAASFNMMIYTLTGLGLGPTVVGMLSDHLPVTASLAPALVIVEAAMVAAIVPSALLARHRYHARTLSITN
jgi:MFS family permease